MAVVEAGTLTGSGPVACVLLARVEIPVSSGAAGLIIGCPAAKSVAGSITSNYFVLYFSADRSVLMSFAGAGEDVID